MSDWPVFTELNEELFFLAIFIVFFCCLVFLVTRG